MTTAHLHRRCGKWMQLEMSHSSTHTEKASWGVSAPHEGDWASAFFDRDIGPLGFDAVHRREQSIGPHLQDAIGPLIS